MIYTPDLVELAPRLQPDSNRLAIQERSAGVDNAVVTDRIRNEGVLPEDRQGETEYILAPKEIKRLVLSLVEDKTASRDTVEVRKNET